MNSNRLRCNVKVLLSDTLVCGHTFEQVDYKSMKEEEAEPQVYYEAEDYDAYLDRLESQSDSDEDEESDDFFDIDQFPLPPTTTKTPTRPRRMEGDSFLSPFMSSSSSLSEIYATPSTPVRSSKLQSPGLGYF